MSLPRYPEYKDSGVEWLGEVPGHWELVPLSRTASDKDSKFIDGDWIESKDLSNDGIRYLTSGNVGDGFYKEQGQGFISESTFVELNCVEVFPGDVLISRLNLPIGRSCLVPDLSSRIVTCVDNVIVRPDQSFDRRFFVHALSSKSHFANMENLARGTTMQRISRSTLGRVRFAFPPLAEQTQIAAFLDRETAKIDELVAEQRRLMALLKEKRQAVISHAVTRGMNPNAPLKPSGIEWLGDVPGHWEIGPLKRYWGVTDCKHVTAEFVDEGIPLASIREVQSRWVSLENAKCTTEHFYALLIEGGRCPLPGDLIFSRNATVGEVAQVSTDHPRFAMGQDVVLLRKLSPEYSSDYLQHVIRSPIITLQLANMMIGSTFKRINVEEIRSFVMPSPPPVEQGEISAYLEGQLKGFDTLTTEAQRAIDLLQERRTALISAAVTGQIDVRGAAVA